jgi:hypothetical protein
MKKQTRKLFWLAFDKQNNEIYLAKLKERFFFCCMKLSGIAAPATFPYITGKQKGEVVFSVEHNIVIWNEWRL